MIANMMKNIYAEIDSCQIWILALLIWNAILTGVLAYSMSQTPKLERIAETPPSIEFMKFELPPMKAISDVD